MIDKQDIKDRQKLSWEGTFYSLKRIDLLIISISGSGIYICFETIKYLVENKYSDIPSLIKCSGITFLLAIIINFISQITGHLSNKNDFLMCDAELAEDEDDINKYDKESAKYDKITQIFNYSSMVFMCVGLATIVYYFLFIFSVVKVA